MSDLDEDWPSLRLPSLPPPDLAPEGYCYLVVADEFRAYSERVLARFIEVLPGEWEARVAFKQLPGRVDRLLVGVYRDRDEWVHESTFDARHIPPRRNAGGRLGHCRGPAGAPGPG